MEENEVERTGPVEISLLGILADLENGITRKDGDKGYCIERGSIQSKYGLTKSDVTELFKHPALVGKKVKIPKVMSFIIKDDIGYGTPSVAAQTRMAATNGGSVEGQLDKTEELVKEETSEVSIEATNDSPIEEPQVDGSF